MYEIIIFVFFFQALLLPSTFCNFKSLVPLDFENGCLEKFSPSAIVSGSFLLRVSGNSKARPPANNAKPPKIRRGSGLQ